VDYLVLQVVQKQELRATFEKYGVVDEVYIAQAGRLTPLSAATHGLSFQCSQISNNQCSG